MFCQFVTSGMDIFFQSQFKSIYFLIYTQIMEVGPVQDGLQITTETCTGTIIPYRGFAV